MAVSSMTGFGRWETRISGLTYTVEIRSVNHRYLESSMRLHGAVMASEQKVREILQKSLDRGRINVSIDINGAVDAEDMVVDNHRIEAYLRLARKLKKEHGLEGEIDLPVLLSLPEVIVRRTREIKEAEVWPVVEKGIHKALADLMLMRRREGRALAADLRNRLRTIIASFGRIEKRAVVRSGNALKELRGRIEKLLENMPVDDDKMAHEAAFLADRLDCVEEVVRARSHAVQFERFLKEGGPVGRKLNFLLQELHREINTIGSKANDVEISREVVFLKEEVERLREQVQNLE
ncbi:MAG: YicC/YloC family endoribonuclease [Candidatus Eisenbacteria bacterium]